jgi:poly-gamma-glutamate capsule biosynthesis protein CapA/YwtB (metallophosphatase superfamily)
MAVAVISALEKEPIILSFVGDIMLARRVGERLGENPSGALMDGVRNVFEAADAVVGNLECPLAERATRERAFKAGPRCVSELRDFDVLNLANNHILDCGEGGAEETIGILKANGIATVGIGTTAQDAHRPALIRARGRTIAFLGCCSQSLIPNYRPEKIHVAMLEDPRLLECLRIARREADAVVLSIHAGNEYVAFPPPSLRRRIRQLLEHVVLVVTHHPHVMGGHEFLASGKLVWYSLGDFVFDSPVERRRRGGILEVYLDAGSCGISDFKLRPTYLGDGFVPAIAGAAVARAVKASVERVAAALGKKTYGAVFPFRYWAGLGRYQLERAEATYRRQGAFAGFRFIATRFRYVRTAMSRLFRGDYR